MAARTFAQISCSLLRSRKLRDLDHQARWAYLCAHLTTQASYTGVFVYPEILWARDADLDADEFRVVLKQLVDAELIEWCEDEELLRIVGCFSQRPPQNPSTVVSHVADFEALLATYDSTELILRAIAEFAVAAIGKAASWKPDTLASVRVTLGLFLRATWQEHEDELAKALLSEAETAKKAVMAELDSLMPALSMTRRDTVPTPCPDRADIRRRRRDEDEDEDENEHEEKTEMACPHRVVRYQS